MDRMIAGLARLVSANPAAAARQFALTGLAGVIAALLFLTSWVTAITGVIFLLAHSVGAPAAVFVVAGMALFFCLALLLWVTAKGRAQRRERQIRAEAQRSVITALLTTLPKGRKSTLIMAGLVAFALFSAKSRHGPDDQG